MIHEVLLALSGHPSPLLDDNASSDSTNVPLLSSSERALLQTLGGLARVHRQLKAHAERIASIHPSIICRAVAVSIQRDHLGQFQRTILDTESRILKNDASLVGAYDIVPLASVVSEFDAWHRRMDWYWDVACFMLQPQERPNPRISLNCSGSKVIDKLRLEAQTGYPDIEEAANQLTRVAETAWLRQLSAWVVYGKLPTIAAQDFFVQAEESDLLAFKKQKHLLPAFVPASTANAMLLIGRSIHHVEHHQRQLLCAVALPAIPNNADLAAEHLNQLASLTLPLLPSAFSNVISNIRLSLSRNVLQYLLPQSLTTKALACLRQFFLLDRGEFALSLITEAEHRLQTRQQSIGRLLQQDPVKAFRGLTIKSAELAQTLSQTWRTLLVQNEGDDDEVLAFAQEHIGLAIPSASDSRPSTADSTSITMPDISAIAFNNLLFPTPTKLSLNITAPLTLFLFRQELDIYSTIHAYFLAIRRGHLKLSDLWRRSSARREQASAGSSQPWLRARINRRSVAMRKVWATCSAAVFLLAEMAAFFEGEIVRGACSHFHEWTLGPPADTANAAEHVSMPANNDTRTSSTTQSRSEASPQRDPESLAAGHRVFLAALAYAVLLTDVPFTRSLRSLLGNVDQLIAFFGRLLDVQQRLDAERSSGAESAHTVEDEQRMALELDRARKKVDSDLRAVVHRLRQLDHERIGSRRNLELAAGGDYGGYEPWKGGGVDRLLMKLDFGRMVLVDSALDLV